MRTFSLTPELLAQAETVAAYGQFKAEEFLNAAKEHHEVAGMLGCGDEGLLGSPANANVVRRVGLPTGQRAVLKLSVTAAWGESALLRLWEQRDLPAVRALDAGVSSKGRPWILTAWLEGSEVEAPHLLPQVRRAATLAAALRLPVEAAAGEACLRGGELSAALRSLPECLRVKTLDASEAIQLLLAPQIGAGRAARLRERVEVLAAGLGNGSVSLLHGDLRHRNVLECSGELYALDPAGATGPPEAEVGTWIAIACASVLGCAQEAVAVACAADPVLDPEVLRIWVGLELLVLAESEQTHSYLGRPPEALALLPLTLLEN